MSLFAEMQSAATEAQSVLAQLQGMNVDGTNALIGGAAFVGVYGNPQVTEAMNPGGGYKRRVELPFSITRTQLAEPFPSKTVVTRTDVSPHVDYRIDTVDTHDPLRWGMTLVKVGE